MKYQDEPRDCVDEMYPDDIDQKFRNQLTEKVDKYTYKILFYTYVIDSIDAGDLVWDSRLIRYIWKP